MLMLCSVQVVPEGTVGRNGEVAARRTLERSSGVGERTLYVQRNPLTVIQAGGGDHDTCGADQGSRTSIEL